MRVPDDPDSVQPDRRSGRESDPAAAADRGELHTPAPGLALKLAIGLCVLAVVALGLWPGPLVDAATRAGADFVSLSASPAPTAR